MTKAAEIPGVTGYRATTDGRIESSMVSREWRTLATGSDAKGYQSVSVIRNGRRQSARVHRLVAEAFLPNPEGLPCVRHLNGDPSDNRVSNLAWGTYRENEHDKKRHGTYWTRFGGGKLSLGQRRAAFQLRAAGVAQSEIAARFSVSRPTITRLLNGSTWSACE